MNSCIRIAFALICFAFHSAQARQSDFGLGFNVNTPYFAKPVGEIGDTSINIGGEWTPRRWFTLLGEFEFAVNGFHEVGIFTGPRFYVLTNHSFRPFFETGGLFQFHPRADGGIRGGVGLAWNLRRLLGVERTWFVVRWGVGALFRPPAALFFDLFRVGLTATY